MQFVSRKRKAAPSIIIVSLVDVLLVVLIFLMVASTLKKVPAYKVNLPESKHAKQGSSDKNTAYVITVGKEAPYIHLDGGAVTTDALLKALADQLAKNPDLVVQLRPDKAAPIGEILKVLETIREAKVKGQPSLLVAPEGAPQ
jgi:biopolymer transport protein ExbD